jgi:serine phosphatase RsbU (regulator of sigma subunit)/CHASE2 domain-containing sensor protein
VKVWFARRLPGPAARIRAAGTAVLLLLMLLSMVQAPWTDRLQSAWFDAHQLLLPRQVTALPVTVVEIDQKSLQALGQWPWPRTELARLVRTLQAAQPAAIGLNVLMPEADALSAERLLAQPAGRDPAVAAALRQLPANDEVLAGALASGRVVLAMAGSPEATATPLRATPITVRDPRVASGPPEPVAVTDYAGVLRSLDVIDRSAAGHGLISVETTRGVVRRMALVARIHGTLVPCLALEMVRVAQGAGTLHLTASGRGVVGLQAGRLNVPVEADGAVRPYFSRHRPDRSVSAIDVLEGRVDPAQLRGQMVLVGLTALGLQDGQDTSVGEHLSASEIHAQLLENLLGGTLLRRPPWAPAAELLLLLVIGGAMVWTAPRTRPMEGALRLAAGLLLPAVGGLLAFRYGRLLLDTATPGLYVLVLSAVLLALSLAESIHHRQQLQTQVQIQREESARMGGELQAAQRIQTGSLPRGDLLAGDARVQLKAVMTPAREVGGDLYDYFMLDAHRLFLMVGDVAGKGLSASIFMAVSKALVKGAMLRSPHADPGEVLIAANAEISRDNPEMLFVSVFAAVLDLDSGRLRYCNAGHDNPYVLQPPASALGRIEDGDGPPLCTLAEFAYCSAERQLQPGDLLCMVTDGVIDAQDAAGQRYGPARATHLLGQASQARCGAAALVESLHASVMAFAASAEPADDLTILALRWQGVPPVAALG